MASKGMNGSLPNFVGDNERRDTADSKRLIELKTLSAKSSGCLVTNGEHGRRDGDDSSTITKASSLSRERTTSLWCGTGNQMQYIERVVAGVKMGDHVKMTELVSKLGTEGFAAVIREHDVRNNTPLHYAALNDDILMTKLLLQYGADVNAIGEGGKHPLHFAAIRRVIDRGSPSRVNDSGDASSFTMPTEASYSQHSDENEKSDQEGQRPRHSISLMNLSFLKKDKKKGKKNKKKKSFKSELPLQVDSDEEKPFIAGSLRSLSQSLDMLDELDENPNDKKHGNEEGNEAAAVDENVVDILLKAGANASAKDAKGMTPLHLAFMKANMDAFKRLLSVPELDINAQDRRGATPLFHACKSGNTDGALILINRGADILISDVNGDTPLHVAVRHSHTLIVTALIEVAEGRGEINQVMLDENSRGVIPLYDAIRCGHRDLFKTILSNVSTSMPQTNGLDIEKLVNFASRDNDDTLLHVAAAAGYQDIVECLINNGAMVNRVNFDGQTPMHFACEKNNESIALCLVENGGDVNIVDSAGLNPLQVAVNYNSFETLMTLLQSISGASGGQSDEATDILQWSAANNKADILRKILDYEFRFHEMTDRGIMDFIMGAVKRKHGETVHVLVRWNRAVVDHRDELGNTPLHYAAEGGHHDIARELILAKAQVNAKNGEDLGGLAPLHYVAARGWTRTAHVLLDSLANIDQTDNQSMTPLHHACRDGNINMVDLLLNGKGAGTVTKPADVTIQDAKGLNCLDHAIDNDHETIAKMIITHDRWLEVMSVSSLDEETGYRTTPMRKLICSMPDVARMILDRCITVTGGTKIRDKDVHIEFYYELLEDSFSRWMRPVDDEPDAGGGVLNSLLNRMYNRVSTRLPSDINVQYDEKDHLLKSSTPFIRDAVERNDNHPVQLMISSTRVELLDHPLVTTFLEHKWRSFGRYIFYAGFLIYITFLAMLTGYIVVIPPDYYVRSVNHSVDPDAITWFGNGEQLWIEDVPSAVILLFDVFGPTAIMILSIMNILRELGQMFVQRFSYFRDGGNIMELFLYIFAIIFSVPFSHIDYVANGRIKKHWQWPIGAAAGFLGWINLLLFIRCNSKLGIYVIMFIDIFKTFLRFSFILFLFVMAFGIAFYALLLNQNPFHSFFDSLAKTFVMMIGELDYADIFYGQDYLGTSNTLEGDGEAAYFMNSNFYGRLSQLFFMLFLIVMAILMMNMMVGLAVDDIQAIQEKANLHSLTMQASMALENQSKFPLWLWRRSVSRRKKFLLNEVKLRKWLRRLTGGRKQLKRALAISHDAENPLSIESPQEEAYEKIKDRIKDVSLKVEQATVEMLEEAKKRDAQLEHLSGEQKVLHDRADHLQSTQERLGDSMEIMHRKMDVMIKKLKIKQKNVEGLFRP
ncbi:transient receptor potential cation channel subfamily A member 1 homolog [Lytechinus variegatus]|uniref:transient receptor potential cation channel subfamily A member 1 homolog n=1 Tax=Lytechinus variegatus TaxID=7654 RepID=UPI001BB13B96|nr:transient receptor potential cation channel subfamily A member 1 homolog [Lytechinus variegatus]